MYKFSLVLSIIMKIFLVIFFFFCAFGIVYNMQCAPFGSFEIIYLLVIILTLLILYFFGKLRSARARIVFAVCAGAMLRIFWLFNADAQPVSDYYTMYCTADEALAGNYSAFKGVNYFSRFPHLTVMTMYIAAMKMIFSGYALSAMKCVNVVFGSLTVYLVYVICKKISANRNERTAYIAASLTAVFPPFITYTGILCTENIAIPLFITSMISFYCFFENRKGKYLYISGIVLAFGNLFRMVAMVMLIGYVLYIMIFTQEQFMYKIRNTLRICVPYAVVIVVVSSLLIFFGVTETHLWNGCEPKSANVLKGINFDTGGQWSEEDGKLISDNLGDKIALDMLCKEKISARIKNRSLTEIVSFYIKKIYSQWSSGDCGGAMITQHSSDKAMKLPVAGYNFIPFQIFIALLYVLSIYGICKTRNRKLNLVYMIFGGYIMLLIVTENQVRYSLMSIWMLLLLCAETGHRRSFLC